MEASVSLQCGYRQLHVVVIWQRFLPYHRARIYYLERCLSAMGHRLSALEVASNDATYDEISLVNGSGVFDTIFPGCNYHALGAKNIRDAVLNRLRLLAPDVVFSPASAFPEGMGAFRYRLENKCISILMDDAWEHTDKTKIFTRVIKRLIHRNIDAAFIPAPSYASYFQSLGFSKDRLIYGVDVVDNDFFFTNAAATRSGSLESASNLNLPQNYFLFVGRFLLRKGLRTLLVAYSNYRSEVQTTPWDLVIVGAGPDEAFLRHMAQNISGIHFAGVHVGEDLCRFYGMANVLVVPSESDSWALVVNEGMAAGLPVLVSRGCGCATTLVREGKNGWSFEPGDVKALSGYLKHITELKREKLIDMGVSSRELIDNWGLERFATGVIQALTITPRPPACFLAKLAVLYWKGRIRIH